MTQPGSEQWLRDEQTERWLKNQDEHNAIRTSLTTIEGNVADLRGEVETLNKLANITPLLIRWVIFPLVSILGVAYGAKEVIASFADKL